MVERRAIVAVLAGGNGRRIGGAKALRPLAGRPLICHPLQAAHAAGLEALVVAKPATALPPGLPAQVLHEPHWPTHPLCGALTALSFAETRSPSPAVLLLACDMPFLTAALLAWLAELDGAALAEVGGHSQPLPARLTSAHRQPLSEALAAQASLRDALSSLAPRIISERELSRFGCPQHLCFNVNDSEDLSLAERSLSRAGEAPDRSGDR
jgi:molybdenum cofactor guanylyltransferase